MIYNCLRVDNYYLLTEIPILSLRTLVFLNVVRSRLIHKALYCVFIGFQETLGHIRPQASADTQTQAALEVINRTIPQRAKEFSVEVAPEFTTNGKETFRVSI